MNSKHVLIVDDEERIREVVQACLVRLANWKVTTAASGAEAIIAATTDQPDAILLDVSMPGMDGIETFQKLQGDPKTHAIPVIFLTAKVQRLEQAQYQQLGVAGLIVKPFDPVQISHDISRLLGWL